jgi:hypothetical protein
MDSFEARLGPRAWQPADEEKVDAGAGSLVLVVLDVNKELTTSALDWALSCVVQRGDTVKVLGILHHIMTPSENFLLAKIYFKAICPDFDGQNK